VHHRLQRKAIDHFSERVYVVGHHAPGNEAIALAIEVPKCLLYHFSDCRYTKPAGAVALIQVSFDAPAAVAIIDLATPQGVVASVEEGLWHGIGKAKSDELNLLFVIKMR